MGRHVGPAVSVAGSPFTDTALVRGGLYASQDRLASRTSALHRAKVSGRHAGEVIADLAADAAGDREHMIVADVGCGRGTTARMIAQRLPCAQVIAVDASPAMLAAARRRLTGMGGTRLVRADFHRLPLAPGSFDVAVAAFCLYHSPAPGDVVGEITRCLRPGGTAIVAVKSAGSYRELDHLVAASGVDPQAMTRPSLYLAAHSGNVAALVSARLNVQRVIHDSHRFVFADLGHVAEYLATSPKYDLRESLAGDASAISRALREWITDGPVAATSIVSYVTATRPLGGLP